MLIIDTYAANSKHLQTELLYTEIIVIVVAFVCREIFFSEITYPYLKKILVRPFARQCANKTHVVFHFRKKYSESLTMNFGDKSWQRKAKHKRRCTHKKCLSIVYLITNSCFL